MEKNQFQQLLARVRQKKPLIHQLTNQVTINDCANVTLAIGASPVMTASKHEVRDMVRLADALVVNFGTLNDDMYESMLIAGHTANNKGIPVVLDPVGAGATPYRTEKIREFLQKVRVAAIRGNISEIHALSSRSSTTRGVDAGDVAEDPQEIAGHAARIFSTVVAVTGVTDYISDGTTTYRLNNGDPALTSISGTGCMSTALIASFSAVCESRLHAAAAGVSVMSIAGEVAKKETENAGLGTYRVKLMDAISLFDSRSLYDRMKLTEIRKVKTL